MTKENNANGTGTKSEVLEKPDRDGKPEKEDCLKKCSKVNPFEKNSIT